MEMLGSSPQVANPTGMKDSNAHLRHYIRNPVLEVRQQDAPLSMGFERLQVSLPEPALVLSQRHIATSREMLGTGCVLPGADPRGGSKSCQDNIFFKKVDNVLLAGVIDGHGEKGESVARFCKEFAELYLESHIQQALEDPSGFLVNLNEDCHSSLKEAVNCTSSGCTSTMVLYADGKLHSTNVGDCRAILATTAPHEGFLPTPRREDSQLLEAIKAKRMVTSEHFLSTEQVTEDHRPMNPGELERITKAGGVVTRLEDENGRKVGPYRVWKVDGMYPGISISRTLGDLIAKELGVISTPGITFHEINPDHDYFIVLASDGVWDMMENQEVCDLVEAFRHTSVRDVRVPRHTGVVEPGAVTVAQLLCEEARARWLTIVEAEDVLIDDISCIVLELQVQQGCQSPPLVAEQGVPDSRVLPE